MRALIQRVSRAAVEVEGEVIGKIGKGLLIFLGVGQEDDRKVAEQIWHKVRNLRIFEDAEGKTNLSLDDVDGQVLVVSQFTLYASCRKGNRPSFTEAAPPALGIELYDYFCELVKMSGIEYATGSFGADMKVSLLNDGPFTIWLDSDQLKR